MTILLFYICKFSANFFVKLSAADVCSVPAQKGDGEFGIHLCGFYIKKYPAHHCEGYQMN